MQASSRTLALRAALIAAFVLGLGLVWRLALRGAAPAPTVGHAARVEQHAGEVALIASELSAATEAPPAERELLSETSSNVPASARIALDASGVLVLVRMRDTREPVAGAVVRWLDEWKLEYGQSFEELLEPDYEKRLQQFGAVGKTDDEGTLRVPRPLFRTSLHARAGNACAQSFLWSHSDETEVLELAHDEALELRVVDVSGEPQAGVPVALASGSGSRREVVWTGLSAADGRAHCSTARGSPLRERDESAFASFAFPMHELVQQRLELGRSGPLVPLTLVLPPTGRLRVRVLEHDGRLSQREGVLRMFATRSDRSSEEGVQVERDETTYSYAIRAGEVQLPHIGLGLKLELGISTSSSTTFRNRVEGPLHPGQAVVFELRRDPPPPSARGRALDESGVPIAHARLLAAVLGPRGGSAGEVPIATDAKGRFSVPIVSAWKADAGPRSLQLSSREHARPPRVCRLDLSFDLLPGGVELGDCELSAAESPLIAAGRVLDQHNGAPIAGVRLTLMQWSAAAEGGAGAWQATRLERTFSDAQGAFALHGDAPLGELALDLHKQRYCKSVPVALVGGSEQLELRLALGGGLEGNVLVGPGIDPSDLDLQLVRQMQTEASTAVRVPCRASGAFEQDGLEPGTYCLRIAESSIAAALLEIPDLEIRSGAIARDPRIADIDLRKRLRALDVRAIGPDGRPVESGSVYVLAPELGAHRWRDASGFDHGRARLIVSTPTVDLQVSAPDLRTRRIEGVREDIELRLEPGLALSLSIEGKGLDPQARLILRVHPQQGAGLEDPMADVRHAEVQRVDAWAQHPHASVVLGSPGIWIVTGTYKFPWNTAPELALQPVDGNPYWILHVLDVPEDQHFTLEHMPVLAPSAAGAK